MSDPGTPDIIARLEAVQRQGREQQRSFAARLSVLEDLLAAHVAPSPVTARVSLDDRGYPIAVHVEFGESRPSPVQVRAALGTAFVTARTAHPTLPVEAAEPLAEVLAAAAQDPQNALEHYARVGETVSNYLGQVSVTALFGDVVSVEADDAWLAVVEPHDLAAEVLAVAQRAAAASDRFARFTDTEVDDA